jgi:CRISPR-associated endonuclease Csn1
MVYAVDDANGREVRWEHEIISRLDAHLRLRQNGGGRKVRRELRKRGILPVENVAEDMAVPERILFSRTADEIRNMATPPFKLKPGESVRLLFVIRKNDMIELDGPNGNREIYRVQKISDGEIQLCGHFQSSVSGSLRNPWNRLQSVKKLWERKPICIRVNPIGRCLRSDQTIPK